MSVRALPYIRIWIQMLISLPLLINLSPKNSLSICNTPKDLAKESLKISDHFRSPSGFFLCFTSDLTCTIFFLFLVVLLWSCLECVFFNRRYGSGDGTIRKVLGHTRAWGCPNRFEKFLSLGFWPCYHFARRFD